MKQIVKCEVEGDLFELVEQGAGRALETGAGLTVTARIYEPEDVRLYSAPRLAEEGMGAVAASLTGSPVNYEHRPITDADPMQGVIRGAWVEDGAIYSELHLTGDRVLAEMSAGIRPGWSVEYTYSRSDLSCGQCGADWFDLSAACSHLPGQVVEGETTYIVAGGRSEGVGLAYTARPASHGTRLESIGAMASANEGDCDLMAPAVARLTERGKMEETRAEVEAVEATAPAEAVEATADLESRLAAAEAENQILRERMIEVEASQQRAEAAARASANRQRVIDMARAGKVADVRGLIALRAKTPAELSTFDEIESFVDAVIECATGSGVRTGQISEAAITDDADLPKSRADVERRAVELAAEKSIPFSQARRLAYAEEG
tara:strand:+ start:7209 stop:8345 length:1137 start_codon:yes stop_codon:yes gene_type:complete